jgi:outer membrane immunogenic protein
MTRIMLGTTMLAGLLVAGVAQAADMPLKAPRAAPYFSWTGCYLGAGGGYGMFNQENSLELLEPARVRATADQTGGGRGWFGTVGGGCDYQISERWVIGAFADYDFSDIHGHAVVPGTGWTGTEKQRSAWSVGGRIGYLINPSLLTYVAGGFTEARFSNTALVTSSVLSTPSGATLQGHTFDGWFLGTGYEYQLGWLPGLFWKTEYRFAQYDREFVPITADATGHSGFGLNSKPFVQTIRSELVWRFNWGGRY